MTRDDPFKTRVRQRMAVTDESYTQARRLLTDYPAPTADELAIAEVVEQLYEPRFSYDDIRFALPDHFGQPGPDGEVRLTGRAEWVAGQPCLAIELIEITNNPSNKIPGAWWTSFGIELHEHGWAYSTAGAGTLDWTLTLRPVQGDVYAPTTVRLAYPDGKALFDGPVALSPGWLTKVRSHPAGLLVVAGPVSGSQFPRRFTDGLVADMLSTADLIAARVPVTMDWSLTTGMTAEEIATTRIEGQGVRALPADATPAQRARAEATWHSMRDAGETCRCSGTGCHHGEAHDDEDEPCTGRLLHIDRFPGSLWTTAAWHDVYACDTCEELLEAEATLPDLPWGEHYTEPVAGGGEPRGGTRVYAGVRHPNFPHFDEEDESVDTAEEFDEDYYYGSDHPDDPDYVFCRECGADNEYSCDC